MATHGSILLLGKHDGQVFLNTTHDGYLSDAIGMILRLPALVASHSYLPKILRRDPTTITPSYIKKVVNQHAGGGFEWSLLEIAGALAASHFNRWLVIPPDHIKHLASYDQQPDLTVDFKDLDAVTMDFKEEEEEEMVESIDIASFQLPKLPIQVEKGKITAPLYSMYLHELQQLIAKASEEKDE